MGRYRRKKMHVKNKSYNKAHKTANRTKDLDQVYDDLKPENAEKLKHQEIDTDVPGRYFISQQALDDHNLTKTHKRRLKLLSKEEPYRGPEEKIDNGRPQRIVFMNQ